MSTHLRFIQFSLLGLALLGLWLGLPAIYGGAALGVSGELRDRLYGGERMAPEDLDRYAALRQQSLRFWDSWQAYDDLAQVALTRAAQMGLDKPEARKLLPDVLRYEKEALLRNPANGYAWARLAYARLMYNGPSRLVSEPLWQSVLTAPYEPRLMPSRIMLFLQTKPHWTPDMEDAFPRQVDLAWRQSALETAHAAYLDDMVIPLRNYLVDDPERLAQYDQWITEMSGGAQKPPQSQQSQQPQMPTPAKPQ